MYVSICRVDSIILMSSGCQTLILNEETGVPCENHHLTQSHWQLGQDLNPLDNLANRD